MTPEDHKLIAEGIKRLVVVLIIATVAVFYTAWLTSPASSPAKFQHRIEAQ